MVAILDWLVDIREKERWTRPKLAKELGLSRMAYYNYEHEIRKVSPDKAKKIAEILNFEEYGISWTKFYDKNCKNTS